MMQPSYNSPYQGIGDDSQARGLSRFFQQIYGLMSLGLAITGITAWYVAHTPGVFRVLVANLPGLMLLFVGQVALVGYLSVRIERLDARTATGLFMAYSFLNGITGSVLFQAYTGASLGTAFLVTSSMFGAAAFFGTVTKRNLLGMGHFLMVGLIGFVIASLVNLFLQSAAIYWMTTYAAVIVFTGLTAYHTYQLRQLYYARGDSGNAAISGALMLYLNFLNLFYTMARLLGQERR